MCSCFSPLLKAIDAYLQKADGDLAEELAAEGYLDSVNTVDEIARLEDDIAAALAEETERFKKAIAGANSLEEFAETVWPEVKRADTMGETLAALFKAAFAKMLPKLADAYIKDTDGRLFITETSAMLTDFVENWSEKLGTLMQLESHAQIEKLLTQSLENGDSIAAFTDSILNSGIRNEYYRARSVALTETLRAHCAAQQEAIMQSPAAEKKKWKHIGAYRTKPRDNHLDMDGTEVNKAEPFVLLGADGVTYYPLYPKDPILPAGESISCHCIEAPVINPEILSLPLEYVQQVQQENIAAANEAWEKRKAEMEEKGWI